MSEISTQIKQIKKELPACPVETTLSLIGDKWKVLILRDLMPGKKRFGELKRSIGSVSQKVIDFAAAGNGGKRTSHAYGICGSPAAGGIRTDGAGIQLKAGTGCHAAVGRRV